MQHCGAAPSISDQSSVVRDTTQENNMGGAVPTSRQDGSLEYNRVLRGNSACACVHSENATRPHCSGSCSSDSGALCAGPSKIFGTLPRQRWRSLIKPPTARLRGYWRGSGTRPDDTRIARWAGVRGSNRLRMLKILVRRPRTGDVGDEACVKPARLALRIERSGRDGRPRRRAGRAT